MENANPIQHILMADDDKDHAMLFEQVLKKEYPDVKLSVVHDGGQLIQFLHLNEVDLLFLDLRMPCKNGYECLQEIKNDPALKDIPIIVYSGSAHITDIQNSFIHKADFYMVKPFDTEHLKTALKIILSTNWKKDPPLRKHYFINNCFVPYTAIA
jgi:CheY-like chemotaxis protein